MKWRSPELDPNLIYVKTTQNIPKTVCYISGGGGKLDWQYLNKWYWDYYNFGGKTYM